MLPRVIPSSVSDDTASADPVVEIIQELPKGQIQSNPSWIAMHRVRQAINSSLINRGRELDLLLLGLLSRQHVLLVGPPGVAKSAICEAVCSAIDGARLFTQLFSKTMDVQDIVGGLDLSQLHNHGIEVRRTDGFLPTADLAFLDEIWNANGTILNSLLRILNEREFNNCGRMVRVPLQTAMAASNIYPEVTERSELRAVYDRFLLRASVKPLIQRDHIAQLVFPTKSLKPDVAGLMTMNDLGVVQELVQTMPFTKDAQDAIYDVVFAVRDEGIKLTDRRMALASLVVRAKAVLDGADAVEPRHIGALSHVFWEGQKDEDTVSSTVMKTADPSSFELVSSISESDRLMDELEADIRKPKTGDLTTVQLGRLGKIRESLARIRAIVKQKKLSVSEISDIKAVEARYRRVALVTTSDITSDFGFTTARKTHA